MTDTDQSATIARLEKEVDEFQSSEANRRLEGLCDEKNATIAELKERVAEFQKDDATWVARAALSRRAMDRLRKENTALQSRLDDAEAPVIHTGMSREELEGENRILRGLVQTNPDWKCHHGMNVTDIGFCPSGFPGCACADDRIAVLCEDESRIVSGLQAENTTLRATAELVERAHGHLEIALSDGANLAEGVAEVGLAHDALSEALQALADPPTEGES